VVAGVAAIVHGLAVTTASKSNAGIEHACSLRFKVFTGGVYP
jgi:hypothetical protein